jgi:hypothetical protein
VPLALFPFAALGIGATLYRRWPTDARRWLFLGVILVGALLGLARLHATGGYCTPRHALLLALPLCAAAAAGLRTTAPWASSRLRHVPGTGRVARRRRLGPDRPESPRAAGAGERRVRELPRGGEGGWPGTCRRARGWSTSRRALYHGERPGYVFANLNQAPANPDVRWVVA